MKPILCTLIIGSLVYSESIATSVDLEGNNGTAFNFSETRANDVSHYKFDTSFENIFRDVGYTVSPLTSNYTTSPLTFATNSNSFGRTVKGTSLTEFFASSAISTISVNTNAKPSMPNVTPISVSSTNSISSASTPIDSLISNITLLSSTIQIPSINTTSELSSDKLLKKSFVSKFLFFALAVFLIVAVLAIIIYFLEGCTYTRAIFQRQNYSQV